MCIINITIVTSKALLYSYNLRTDPASLERSHHDKTLEEQLLVDPRYFINVLAVSQYIT